MGSGLRVKQYARRFYEGEQAREKKEDEASRVVKTFGKYEARETEDGGYELLKGGEVIGIFSKARVEENRIVFHLSHGVNLEVSGRGVREIFSPERAELCGLIAADGTVCKYKRTHEVSLKNVDRELIDHFCKLAEETYSITPHLYSTSHTTKKGEKREYYRAAVLSKKVAYDLWMFGVKGPGPYEFHPPMEHLDDEGMRAYLRGFFSGDGNVSLCKDGKHDFRVYSSFKEGLEEIREMFEKLGFHPHKVREEDKEVTPEGIRKRFYFSIPEEEHLKFIEEIGTRKAEFKRKFELIKLINGKEDN
ncbi:MAG: LAGLIDADG family homing endonuclease [Thermoproteota archaeon]